MHAFPWGQFRRLSRSSRLSLRELPRVPPRICDLPHAIEKLHDSADPFYVRRRTIWPSNRASKADIGAIPANITFRARVSDFRLACKAAHGSVVAHCFPIGVEQIR